MSEITEKKPEEEKKADPEAVEEKEKHSNTDNISESNKAIVDVLSKVADNLVANTKTLDTFADKIGKIEKALEEPTNLAAKPAVSAEDDIGDKVKVPDTYQSNSQQASIDDSDPKNDNEKDPGDLKMQEKRSVSKAHLEKTSIERPVGTVTESPSPLGVENTLTPIEKAYAGSDRSPILDDFRKIGLEEGSSRIRGKILKGDYYLPDDQEVSRW